MIKIAICDDDINFLTIFEQMIIASFTNIGQLVMVSVFPDGTSLIRKVEKEKHMFDVIFMDVEMPLVNGFKAAQRLRELNPVFILIFTTYIEHQSREGYIYGAFRYIFKNNLDNEINEAVPSIIKKLGYLSTSQEKITLKYRNSGVLDDLTLKNDDIIFFKSEKTRRIIIKTLYSEYELLVKPLTEYAKLFDPLVFAIILRSYIVNFNHVESLDDDFFILTGGIAVPLGIKKEVKKASIEKYLNFLQERL